MKVISEGPLQFDPRFTCTACQSELEVEPADVKMSVESGSVNTARFYVNCVVCGEPHNFDEKTLDRRIRNKAKSVWRTNQSGGRD